MLNAAGIWQRVYAIATEGMQSYPEGIQLIPPLHS